MTKLELEKRVAIQARINQKLAVDAVNAVLEQIMMALVRGEKVTMGELGYLSIKVRKPRQGRNPRTGETFMVPARKIVRYRPSRQLKDLLNKDSI